MTRNKPADADYKDEERLQTLYWHEQKSIQDIADRFGVHRDTIVHWMDKFGIERRSLQEGARLRKLNMLPAFVTTSNGYRAWQTQWKGERHQVTVHRLLAVSEYGFGAVVGKHVHHKNGFKVDNRPENIELKEVGEHERHHWYERAKDPNDSFTEGPSQKYSDENLVDYIIEWYQEHGEWPIVDDFQDDDSVPAPRTYADRMGWQNAREQAKEAVEGDE